MCVLAVTGRFCRSLDVILFGHWTKSFSMVTGPDRYALIQNIFSTGFWSQLSSVKHTELRLLFSNLNATVLDSRAKTTVTKYIGGFKHFLKWTQKYKEITSVLSCNKLYVGLYLQRLIESFKGFNSVDIAFYSIKWAHCIADVTDPCESELVKKILEGAKRILIRENDYPSLRI
ncbi:unnamed protein product [Mytilus coruscus]|uniref:Uncharacterized protein n=1 Tax=Mytilus coruscus TaxID=42192 RepID=A0A6J8CIV0_MYTCO|nr:unnamed protein product [Mytilus coruscus]